jgi:hypothetical protein
MLVLVTVETRFSRGEGAWILRMGAVEIRT